jgi:hypothetical protein
MTDQKSSSSNSNSNNQSGVVQMETSADSKTRPPPPGRFNTNVLVVSRYVEAALLRQLAARFVTASPSLRIDDNLKQVQQLKDKGLWNLDECTVQLQPNAAPVPISKMKFRSELAPWPRSQHRAAAAGGGRGSKAM